MDAKPTQVTNQPEPTVEMTTAVDPKATDSTANQNAGEEAPKKKKRGCCGYTVPVQACDGLCTMLCGGLLCLCGGLG
ncbi:hypothetical protein FRC08_004630 [Ceratobasidium sp. 394]|nr:hypothetical protein FRC08_004630 [Ceratobasidium sp. 394]KAG9078687.1 hypothetical protein FS749_009251 [Ceratobasidium sp. UAMH 11750]